MNLHRFLVPMLALIALIMPGCLGQRVQIDSAEVGKVLTTSGLEGGLREPGAIMLDWCGLSACEKLIRLQVGKSTRTITVERVFLPKSNVDLSEVEIALQFRVREDTESRNRIFNEVTPDNVAGMPATALISSDDLYAVYLERVGPEAVIEALRQYTVDEALSHVAEIGDYCHKEVNKRLEGSPIEVTELSFPNGIGDPPEEVLVAKRRLYAVDEEKAREVKALEAELAVEEQRQAVQLARAMHDKQTADRVGVSYETYDLLKVMERFAEEGVPLGYIPGSTK